MGGTKASLVLLRFRLSRAGFEPPLFGYSVARETPAEIVSRFVTAVASAVLRDEPYAVIGHSLGNVIARAASPRLPTGLARVVMLAPPNRPPLLARKLGRNGVFQLLAGDAGQKLGDPAFYATL